MLKDGGLRAISSPTRSICPLKSDDEQKATILQFQSFLNTLDFPIQISVQSRRLDIRPYLLLLEDRMKIQNEPLLKLQTKEYIEFIRNFTESVEHHDQKLLCCRTIHPYCPQVGFWFFGRNIQSEEQRGSADSQREDSKKKDRSSRKESVSSSKDFPAAASNQPSLIPKRSSKSFIKFSIRVTSKEKLS